MRDPHVLSLRYRLVADETTSFAADAPPVACVTAAFAATLDAAGLHVEMHEHYATDEEARAAVEPTLRAWEVKHALTIGRIEFAFEFERAELIDRDPPPPGTPQVVHLKGHSSASAFVTATVHVTRGSYPEPPDGFAYDPDVDTLYHRWQGYLAGREPLQGMAYFALTVLEMYGGRPGAKERYDVSDRVLEAIARLSTETGDERSARKMTPKLRPLTDAERAWLETAIRSIIRRVGEVAAAPESPRTHLTMSDLPSLRAH